MAKSKDDPDQDDEEEFYDSHSNIEELINDAEVKKMIQSLMKRNFMIHTLISKNLLMMQQCTRVIQLLK